MIDWNSDMNAAPKDGTQLLLLWRKGQHTADVGSWRTDEGFNEDGEKLWLDNSYDDFSCGYASRPLTPTHWAHINLPATS